MNSKHIPILPGLHLVGKTSETLTPSFHECFDLSSHRLVFVPLLSLQSYEDVRALQHFAYDNDFIVFVIANCPVTEIPPKLLEVSCMTIMDIDNSNMSVTISNCQSGPNGTFPLKRD